jgi:hypothetical protein
VVWSICPRKPGNPLVHFFPIPPPPSPRRRLDLRRRRRLSRLFGRSAASPPPWEGAASGQGGLPSMGGAARPRRAPLHGRRSEGAAGSPPWQGAARARRGPLHGRSHRGRGLLSSIGGRSEGAVGSPPWEGVARARRAILLRICLASSPFPEQQGDRMISVNACCVDFGSSNSSWNLYLQAAA